MSWSRRKRSIPSNMIFTGFFLGGSSLNHQLERDWSCSTLEQHRNPAWRDDGSVCWCDYYAGRVVVLAARRRSQQDCSDSSAWWWCWEEVALLHQVEVYECIFTTLVCCQLPQFQSLAGHLCHRRTWHQGWSARPLFCTTRLPLCRLVSHLVSYMRPRLCCASACRCSAAFLYPVTASVWSCFTPLPFVYMLPMKNCPIGVCRPPVIYREPASSTA